MVNGMASVNTGCKQCHGSKVALAGDRRQPDHRRRPEAGCRDGKPTNLEAVALIKRRRRRQADAARRAPGPTRASAA